MNVLITGASSGIGNYLVKYYQDQGAQVFGMCRRRAVCHWIPVDLADSDSVKSAIPCCPDALDVLICCAAQQAPIESFVNSEMAVWEDNVVTNLFGITRIIHGLFNNLRRTSMPRAKIFCFGGGGASEARPDYSAYACSKTALVRLVETLAAEWERDDVSIDINAIAPGVVKTAMTVETLASKVSDKERQTALAATTDGLPTIARCLDALIAYRVTGKFISVKWDDWSSAEALNTGLKKVLRRV